MLKYKENSGILYLSLLYEEFDMNSLPPEDAALFHAAIYEKLVDVLLTVFSGYEKTKHVFLAPHREFDECFKELLSCFERLDARKDLHQLAIMDFKFFNSLNENTEEKTKSWPYHEKAFLEDKEKLIKNNKVTTDYFGLPHVPYDVQVLFLKIDTLIVNHNKQKNRYLNSLRKTKTPISKSEVTDKILYKVEYKFTGEIILNGKYLLAKVNPSGENDIFFSYVYNNPRREITSRELNEKLPEFQKKFYRVINELGFKGELLTIFFPRTNKSVVYFQNDITETDLKMLIFDRNKLEGELKTLKTI